MDETPQQIAVILTHIEYIRAAQDETNTHLKELNGRTGRAENRLSVLESHSREAAKASQKSGGAYGAAAGGFVGGLLMVLHAWLSGK